MNKHLKTFMLLHQEIAIFCSNSSHVLFYGDSSWEITYYDCEGIKFKRSKLRQLQSNSLIIYS